MKRLTEIRTETFNLKLVTTKAIIQQFILWHRLKHVINKSIINKYIISKRVHFTVSFFHHVISTGQDK